MSIYKVVQTGFYVEIVTSVTKRVYVANKSFCCICCSVRVQNSTISVCVVGILGNKCIIFVNGSYVPEVILSTEISKL